MPAGPAMPVSRRHVPVSGWTVAGLPSALVTLLATCGEP
jgi:hypothetical protein